MLLHQSTTQAIIDAFFRSYNILGYGFSEAIYGAALDTELRKVGCRVDREVNACVRYDDGSILGRVRIDRLVERKVVVELKSTARLEPGAEPQVYNYLRATNLEVGLLLHYGHRPVFKRFICTNDRKTGFDLREGTIAPILEAADRTVPRE
jgi:GxxExxY protein